jgi:superfamily II DNA/RNA helicase
VAGFRTHCPNCIAEISPKNHLFYVGTDILQSPEGVYEEAASLQAEAAGGFPFPEMAARLRVLVQLLRGEPVSFERSGPLSEEGGILSGRRSCPLPANAPHKYLIFAMYSESMHQIAAALAAGGVAFAELGGGRAKIEEAVARFRAEKGPSILIAKSSTKCAGLHLPEVTRIVFYHHHQNKEVVKQGIGRAQRVGREYNLEVIEILDEGEAAAGRRRRGS